MVSIHKCLYSAIVHTNRTGSFNLQQKITHKIVPLFLLLLGSIFTHLTAQINFQEASHQYGVVHSTSYFHEGGGISIYDFDKDGLDDLTLATTIGQPIGFYRNTGAGFEQIHLLDDNLETAKQITWVDFDNDGDADLYVAAFGGINRLYENEGELVLVDITEKSGLSLTAHRGYGASWGDYNRDGWVDLYYATREEIEGQNFTKNYNRLFKNNADGTFLEQSYEVNAHDEDKVPFCAAFIDYNNDNWPDIYIANDAFTFNTLLANREGIFEDVSIPSGANSRMNAMSVSPGDYNQDGWTDVYITNSPIGSHCLENSGFLNDSGFIRFENKAGENGTIFSGGFGWGANFFDADNDGDLDLYVNSSIAKPKELSSAFFENINKGNFEIPHIEGLQGDTSRSFTNAIGDFNGDGLLDIAVQNNPPDPFFLWENHSMHPTPNHWIKLELEGVMSNRDGIGTKIELYADSLYQMHYTLCGSAFLGQNSSYKHFGTGTRTMVDSLLLTWPSGHIDRFYSIPTNQIFSLKEGDSSNGEILVDEDITIIGKAMSTSTEAISTVAELLLFPNPARQYITIDHPHLSHFEIQSIDGAVITEERITSIPYSKDISSFTNGIYLVKIFREDNSFIIKKLVVH